MGDPGRSQPGNAGERRGAPPELDAGRQQPDNDRALFSKEKAKALREEWEVIQSGFVDEPRGAIERADALVKETIADLASSFSERRASLEKSLDKDGEASTEDLRLGLQSYRSFFQRLLSVH